MQWRYKVKTRDILSGRFRLFLWKKKRIILSEKQSGNGKETRYNYYLLETKGELRQMSYGNKKIIGASMKETSQP